MLTDRVSLLNAWYRLMNTSSDDDDLIEHDVATLEGAYLILQDGVDDAQDWLIDKCGMADFWITTTATITWTGSDPSRYYALPSDFLRIAGDDDSSGLHKANGQSWGTWIPFKQRRRFSGDFFYFKDGRLYLCRNANPPSDLTMDYVHSIATLADATTVDFPAPLRDLIVAFAAVRGASESWLPGGPEMVKKLETHLSNRQNRAYTKSRRTQAPRKASVKATLGDHWF